MSEAKKIIIPKATLTEPCKKNDEGATPWDGNRLLSLGEQYFDRPVARKIKYGKRTGTYSWNLLPVVVDGNAALWPEASLYILDRIIGTVGPSMSTYHSIAEDLAAYKRWLEDEDVDFRHFPANKLERPTYRYRGDLLMKARAGEIAIGSASRMVSAVIGFYRWLAEEQNFLPVHSPWVESDAYIPLTDSKGLRRHKKIKATDLRVHVPKQNDPYTGVIADGGSLRPLPMEEQIMLLDALKKLGNIEMTLIHLLALFSGARIQTVLTLRVRHAQLELPKSDSEMALPVGHGTMIDTKYGKRGVIFIPRWLYKRLRIYSHSDRARARRAKAGRDDENQYLFLSNRGAPLYRSKEDRDEFNESLNIRHEKVGQTVRQYIKDMVLPTIVEMTGKVIRYRFHDLRATFGMNLTDMQLKLVQDGKATLHDVREFVKFRMMHESAATTDLYLQYRGLQKLVRHVQKEYEDYLQLLADRAQGILS